MADLAAWSGPFQMWDGGIVVDAFGWKTDFVGRDEPTSMPSPVRAIPVEVVPDPPKKRRRKRRLPGLHDWAKSVKARDGCCVICGATDGLHAHHIRPKSVAPELALDLDNGETLCRQCHRGVHLDLPERFFAAA